MRQSIIFVALLALIISGCNTGKQKSPEITVFAAISLTDALTEIGAEFSKKYTVEVFFNFAASTTLQRQIEKGASADVFISASPIQADELEELNLIEEGSRTDILSNQLVLIAQKNAKINIKHLNEIKLNSISKVAIGQPDIVPAGAYAKEALKHLNLWEEIQPKLIFGTDVRATLAYVSTGNVMLAFVYETDTRVSDKVKVIYTIPSNTHSSITYPAVVLKGSSQKLKAQEFIEYLKTPIAINIFDNYGFRHQSTDTAHQKVSDTVQ